MLVFLMTILHLIKNFHVIHTKFEMTTFECVICMEDKEFATFVCCTLPCKHYFCYECLSKFEASHCPLCRKAFSACNTLNGKCLAMIKQIVEEHATEVLEEKGALTELQFPAVVDIEDILMANMDYFQPNGNRRSQRNRGASRTPNASPQQRPRRSNARRQRNRHPNRESEVDLVIDQEHDNI